MTRTSVSRWVIRTSCSVSPASRDFVATTEPSKPDDDRLRRLVVARSAAQNEPQ